MSNRTNDEGVELTRELIEGIIAHAKIRRMNTTNDTPGRYGKLSKEEEALANSIEVNGVFPNIKSECIIDKPTEEQGWTVTLRGEGGHSPELVNDGIMEEPHGPGKPTEREPKEAIGPSGLTAKRIEELIIATGLCPSPRFSDREMVRRVVDGLITSGELRVVKKAENLGAEFVCSECHIYLCDATMRQGDRFTSTVNFCPNCGAEITK